MLSILRFVLTFSLILLLAVVLAAEGFGAGWLLHKVGWVWFLGIAVVGIALDFVALFVVTGINSGALFADKFEPYQFGDAGIGQRDDWDSDIRNPSISRMRTSTTFRDTEKALQILDK